ncbi:MAG: hypothetical protein ACTXOO_05320 [Sodalis sp. (in: enterobacteria)]
MHCQAMKTTARKCYRDPMMRKLMRRAADFQRMKAMAALRMTLKKSASIV